MPPKIKPWIVPAILFIFCGISFGSLIPWLGFYWDDWPSIYYLHVLGPRGFIDAFSVDRPSLGWLFMLTSSILGESTLNWQIFGVLARFACSLMLWWMLRSIWPYRPRQVAWVALLFAAYPGFLQQYISVTYSHTWLVLALFFLSLVTMIRAFRQPRWFWPLIGLSWILAAFCMFTDEYFFGLELLRPVILWLAITDKKAEAISVRIRWIFLRWLPYIFLIGVFLFWRLILHASPRGQVQIFDDLRTRPAQAVWILVRKVLQDMVESSLIAWGRVLDIPHRLGNGTGPAALYIGVVLAVFAVVALFLMSFSIDSDPPTLSKPERSWHVLAIGIGLLALLLGGIPFWATSLPIELRFPWDRFTLAMNLGASLLLAGLIDGLIRHWRINALCLAVLLGLAAGMHVQLANDYRREWNAQKAFFWQLVWRAPGIHPGTTILTAELPFIYYSDNSLTAPLNWTYAPEFAARQMPYLFYNIESRLGTSLTGFDRGRSIQENYRALSFAGTTSTAIAIYYNPPGCVKVVDPGRDAHTPQKPLYFSRVLPLSNLDLIQAEADPPAHPPQAYFGAEPGPDWCYYFEKADLARQLGNWREVARLGERAFQLKPQLYEVNAPELLPYIEGYASTGRWTKARDLTQEAHRLTFRMDRILCDTWKRISQEPGLEEQGRSTSEEIRSKLNCTP